jgi:hypothetical protein
VKPLVGNGAILVLNPSTRGFTHVSNPPADPPGCQHQDFAGLLTPCAVNSGKLSRWIIQVGAADLPHLHAFTRGLERDHDAVTAALTLPYSNGPTEGVNTKTKRIARQMHGRADFTLLRHRILLGEQYVPSLPEGRQGRLLDTPVRSRQGVCNFASAPRPTARCGSDMGQACDVWRNWEMSCMGGAPNSLLYSRLNWDALS